MQEDLTSLFDRSLTLQSPRPHQIQYSITQHYHHSSHQISPSHTIQTSPETAIVLLTSHNIDPGCLSPAQQQLFTTLPLPEQLRLIEIWQESPPEAPFRTPAATTLNQEEGLAKARLERKEWAINREAYGFSSTPNLHMTETEEISKVVPEPNNGDERREEQGEQAAGDGRTFQDQAEPYIVTGYSRPEDAEALSGYQHYGSAVGGVAMAARPLAENNWQYSYNRATDPVYSGVVGEDEHASGDVDMG
ncbi:MAG: hypothetical protein M1814_004762 [Vezdaea aestivalis]|nr:MAG: hypothetical protein M1814_004762 [Vezdaea aestivalis]